MFYFILLLPEDREKLCAVKARIGSTQRSAPYLSSTNTCLVNDLPEDGIYYSPKYTFAFTFLYRCICIDSCLIELGCSFRYMFVIDWGLCGCLLFDLGSLFRSNLGHLWRVHYLGDDISHYLGLLSGSVTFRIRHKLAYVLNRGTSCATYSCSVTICALHIT